MSPEVTFLASGTAGPALLFLHGIGGGAEAFRHQLDHFGDRFRAFAWNMPGYGGSPPLAPLTFRGLAGALAAFLDRHGMDEVHLVGHSIGGMIAQEFAAGFPGRVASMTLVATSPAFGRLDGDFQKRFLAERLGPLDAGRGMADLAPEIVASLVGEDPDPEGVALAVACMRRVPEAAYRAAMACLVTFDRRDALASYRMPVLVVAGGRDRNAPPEMMRRMAQRIPTAVFVEIAGAGHLLPLERPRAFERVLDSFLADHS